MSSCIHPSLEAGMYTIPTDHAGRMPAASLILTHTEASSLCCNCVL